MRPEISVIVPSYGREAALCSMLSTLLGQTISSFEILLIDQTEKHTEQTENFLSLHGNRVKRIFQPTPNLPMARNTGLLHAKGKYIIFADDDVLLPPNCVSQLVGHLSRKNADGVTGLINFEKEPKQLLADYEREYGSFERYSESGLIPADRFIGAVMAFRCEVFDTVGGFDERLGVLSSSAAGEDYEFCRRLVKAGFRLAIDRNLVIQHPLGVSGGCGARDVEACIARERQMQSNIYIEMKHSGSKNSMGLVAWLRLLRGWVINRATIRLGLGPIYARWKELRNSYAVVKKFGVQQKP